eukprot:scaffold135132_cov22-Tisochrysis_lutea.AAC.1
MQLTQLLCAQTLLAARVLFQARKQSGKNLAVRRKSFASGQYYMALLSWCWVATSALQLWQQPQRWAVPLGPLCPIYVPLSYRCAQRTAVAVASQVHSMLTFAPASNL